MSRGNTRQRIQDVALKLFAEQGYEKTSLREIAEQLGVTKAALYYHFKTKEDLVSSIFQDLAVRPADELIAWAEEQRPTTLETKLEILRRYSANLSQAVPLFRFMHENQAALRELSIGDQMKARIFRLLELIKDSDAPLSDQVRCSSALFTMHSTLFVLDEAEADPEEKRKAALEVAQELVTSAHRGSGS
ncbi:MULTISPECIES: TetR/AcrR family transcriptional regulator [unclassified Streptomyces]|uniref:TetR/AcrR family transcriptional regulator n=1 Tax=unclassified Streptomyces TaxID=2593676 RepID=UPI002DD98620|nr:MULTISPECIES: TetR/AcrR family transcriptional regulator [unclassified Streptomyces]WSA93174.1 TetR/AcrR family transcriptional regulator [Streptomyces sp. NBC_01795]WSB77545.1 TetR/AcrR family transcriptional regulator [Streptomyces sp. NBC_01775]WSS14189.1 TetR/AcrR family transcriptional regulator [Streptomyces sp. NBC_01186]WSS43010.1 TetR/AcrR family transcriptional regulator [Streptomyces sp. NBC_01187]